VQKREAWCRACGARGKYPTGWSLMAVSDFEAFKKALQQPIRGSQVGGAGALAVRLRLRNLACVSCNERGTLVAGRAEPGHSERYVEVVPFVEHREARPPKRDRV